MPGLPFSIMYWWHKSGGMSNRRVFFAIVPLLSQARQPLKPGLGRGLARQSPGDKQMFSLYAKENPEAYLDLDRKKELP